LRFLVDECIPRAIVEALRSRGEEVEWVRDVARQASDREVVSRSVATRAVIITEDRDFGELVYGMGEVVHGIVLVRLSRFAGPVRSISSRIAERICEMNMDLVGRMTVVEPDRRDNAPFRAESRE
jgi:predicted nuclease of predicted toxin-antitoxin system